MNRRTDKRGNAVSVSLTMLLFLVSVLCVPFTVLIGNWVHENINTRSDANHTGNIILSYIVNKVRQGDRARMVDVADVDEIQVLGMKREIGDSEYITWIYWDGGGIRELFTDTSSGLELADGLKILEYRGLKSSKDGRLLHVEIVGEGDGSLELSLWSGGLETNE